MENVNKPIFRQMKRCQTKLSNPLISKASLCVKGRKRKGFKMPRAGTRKKRKTAEELVIQRSQDAERKRLQR